MEAHGSHEASFYTPRSDTDNLCAPLFFESSRAISWGLLRFLPSFRWQRPQPCHLRLRRSELLAAQPLSGLLQDFRISGSGVLGAGVGLI